MVEPINWIRPKTNFSSRLYIIIKIFKFKFSSSHVKIYVCPGDDLQTFLIRLKLSTDRTCWKIQTHSDEPNLASRRRTFHELNSLSLFRLIIVKSSTFDLCLKLAFIYCSKYYTWLCKTIALEISLILNANSWFRA